MARRTPGGRLVRPRACATTSGTCAAPEGPAPGRGRGRLAVCALDQQPGPVCDRMELPRRHELPGAAHSLAIIMPGRLSQ
jgi:hypothetical protein